MNREELKNIVSEILGNSDNSTFNKFIAKIATSIKGKQSLRLNGIGYFQIKKEPLSRMERKVVGDVNEKDILLFLPEGKSGEENILSIEIDADSNEQNEFNESVFDISINKPTIISEYDDESEDSEIDSNIALQKNITEFVESGDIIEDFELLSGEGSNSIVDSSNEISTANTNEIIIDDIIESDEILTEAEINEEFLSPIQSDEIDEYEVTSSNIEAEITEADLDSSKEGIEEITESINSESEVIGETDIVDENKNPFDELENYLKDDTTDEAQEIIDSEPENANGDADDKSELTVDSAEPKPSKFTKLKFDEWYKKPILYIAILGVIILAFLLYFFIPSTDNKTVDEINNGSITTKQYDFSVVDSTASDDTTKTEIADKEKEAPEIKKETNEIAKKEVAAKVSEPKIAKVPTGLYRESKNDRLVKGRIYFDGKQYTVQSSSWKSNFIAEREVRKLKKRGFDAFIYKVFIKSKNGTWNRVRIGYFNTQKEAEEFLKKNKI